MPWSGASFAKHNRSLTPTQSAGAAKQANAVLKATGDEGMAIAVANKHARKAPPSERLYRGKKGVSRAPA